MLTTNLIIISKPEIQNTSLIYLYKDLKHFKGAGKTHNKQRDLSQSVNFRCNNMNLAFLE